MFPYELTEKIALSDLGTFNKMVRAIPRLGRRTLQQDFQERVINHFGTTITVEGCTRMYLGEKLHSIYDRPALECDYSICWYYCGDLHRTSNTLGVDRPALIYDNGTKHFYRYGKMHRDGGKPAMIHIDGSKHWYQNGRPHRDMGKPAMIDADGSKRYYKHGIIYRQHADNIINKVYVCAFMFGIILYVLFKN